MWLRKGVEFLFGAGLIMKERERGEVGEGGKEKGKVHVVCFVCVGICGTKS